MQYAWGAFKGAVQEINQALLVDSDEEKEGERVSQNEGWNDWSWDDVGKTSTKGPSSSPIVLKKTSSKFLALGESASQVAGFVGSVLPNAESLKSSLVTAVDSTRLFQSDTLGPDEIDHEIRAEDGRIPPPLSQFEEFMHVAQHPTSLSGPSIDSSTSPFLTSSLGAILDVQSSSIFEGHNSPDSSSPTFNNFDQSLPVSITSVHQTIPEPSIEESLISEPSIEQSLNSSPGPSNVRNKTPHHRRKKNYKNNAPRLLTTEHTKSAIPNEPTDLTEQSPVVVDISEGPKPNIQFEFCSYSEVNNVIELSERFESEGPIEKLMRSENGVEDQPIGTLLMAEDINERIVIKLHPVETMGHDTIKNESDYGLREEGVEVAIPSMIDAVDDRPADSELNEQLSSMPSGHPDLEPQSTEQISDVERLESEPLENFKNEVITEMLDDNMTAFEIESFREESDELDDEGLRKVELFDQDRLQDISIMDDQLPTPQNREPILDGFIDPKKDKFEGRLEEEVVEETVKAHEDQLDNLISFEKESTSKDLIESSIPFEMSTFIEDSRPLIGNREKIIRGDEENVSDEFESKWKSCKDSLIDQFGSSPKSDFQVAVLRTFSDSPKTKMEAERFCIDLLEILKNLRSEVATSRELIVSEEQHNAENRMVEELRKEVEYLKHHITVITNKAAETFERYRQETEAQQEEANNAHQEALLSYKNRYDSLMEQYKRLQQAGRELTQKQSGTESAQSALFERIERLEMENGDYAEQLESWQRSHAQVSETHHRLSAEASELRHRCVNFENVVEELEEAQRSLQNHKKLQLEYNEIELQLKEKSELVARLQSDIAETQDVVNRLNRLVEDVNGDQDARTSGLEIRLAQTHRELAETRTKLSVLNDQSTELESSREEVRKLRAEVEEARSTAAAKEQHNEVLSGALKKVLDRLHAKVEDSDYLIDRRVIESRVKEYYKILAAQGVINVMGKAKDEMIYVLSEACSLPPDINKMCLGINESTEAHVRRTRVASLSLSLDSDSPPEGEQPNRRPIASMFLDFLEAEAA